MSDERITLIELLIMAALGLGIVATTFGSWS
jgi:hypothetical protein